MKLYCFIGFTLLFSSIIMNLLSNKNQYISNFLETLDENQKKIYSEIVYERLMIYVKGMLLGLLFGIIFLYKYPKDKYKICKFFAIVFSTKLIFYYIYPKKKLMLYHLKTKEQISGWADIYLHMKKTWITSIIISAIGYVLIAKNF